MLPICSRFEFLNRHGTKFWKILKSQNFGHIDIDFDIENYSFKILILILILKFAFPKYWFWYWYWTFWEFWYWYWYWYWKKGGNIENFSSEKNTSASLTLRIWLDFSFFSPLSFDIPSSWVLGSCFPFFSFF